MNPDRETEIAIFNSALELQSAEARARYLDQACQGNPDRRKRIEALLQAYEASLDFLDTNLPVAKGSPVIPFSPVEEVGTTIGRYKLLEKIGEGGFGVVYMAEQKEPLKRRVALKIIKLGMDTKQVVARFEAERQALALMDHPNIAKVLDGGATETGRPYFVMELVRGVPVTQFCDQNQLTTSARLELFVQICQALQHAHQKGIIHRDIKPTNILVTRYDDRAIPKVIDFGIAKAIQQELTEKTLFTQFQQFIGTPAYMSPEQAQWSGLDIDTRSDIYSLGVLLYELLTGSTPLKSRELLQAGYDEMRRRIREEDPPLPSTRVSTMADAERHTIASQRQVDPRKFGMLLRGDLDWIVMRALQKDRARRYSTAHDFAQDLQRFLANEPVNAAPPSPLYRFRRFSRRHKASLAAAAAIAGLLIAGTILSSWLAFAASTAKAAAEEETERSRLAREQEAKQRTRAETNEAMAKQLLTEARHEQGKTLLASAEHSREQLHFFEANLVAARALGFHGYGRPTNNSAFNGTYPILLKPGSSEEAQAKRFIDREPDYAPLWRSDLGRHHPNPFWEDFFQSGHTLLWQIAFADQGRRLLTKLVTGIRYWDVSAGGLITEYSDPAYAAISPQGDFIVSNDERQFTLRDPNTGHVLRLLEGSTGPIRRIASSHNAKVLAIALDDGQIRLYDQEKGSLISSLSATNGLTEALALDAAGQWLAVAGTNTSIQLCDVASGKLVRRLEGHQGRIRTLAFASKLNWLASGGDDQSIRLWAPGEWVRGPVLKGHTDAVHSLVFHPSKSLLISGGADHGIRVWDINTSRLAQTLDGHENVIHALAVDPEGNWLASGCKNGVVLLWDLKTFQPRFVPQTHLDGISSVRISPDGALVASGSYDRTVRLWASRNGELAATLRGHRAPVHSVDFNSDGSLLASVDADSVVITWDVARREQVRRLDPGKQTRRQFPWMRGRTLQFHPDGQRLLSRRGPTPIVWNAISGERLFELEPLSANIITLTWDPSGFVIAAADVAGGMALWRLPDLKPYLRLEATRFTCSLEFDREGRHVIRTGEMGFEFLNVESGKLERTMGSSSTVSGSLDFLFNSTDTMLVSSGPESIVSLWDKESGIEVAKLAGHRGRVSALDLAPDNSFLVTSGLDGTLILWDLTPSRARTEWILPSEIVGLAFDETGQRVIAAGSAGMSASGQFQIRDAQTGELVVGHSGLLPQSPLNWKAVAGSDPLWIGSTDGKLQKWNASRGMVELAVTNQNSALTQLALDPQRHLLAAFYVDRTIHLWDSQAGTKTRSWHIGITADAMAFLPNSTQLGVTSRSKSVEFWNIQTGEPGQRLEIQQGHLSQLSFSRDGARMVTGGDQLRIWALAGRRIEFETDFASEFEFLTPTLNPQASLLVSARLRKSGMRNQIWAAPKSVIEVREFPSGRLLAELPMRSGSSGNIYASPLLSFSPDGNHLAAGWIYWNSMVRVYDLKAILSERVDLAGYSSNLDWSGSPTKLVSASASTNLFATTPGIHMRPYPSSHFLRLQQDASEVGRSGMRPYQVEERSGPQVADAARSLVSPEGAARLRALFWRAFMAENWASAGALLGKLKQTEPNPREQKLFTSTLLGEATKARNNGLNQLALHFAEQAVKASPENPEAWAGVAEFSLLRGKHDRAGEAIRELMRLQPEAPISWRLSGDLAASLKDTERALSGYQKAMDLARATHQVEWKDSLKARAKLLHRLGRVAEAKNDQTQGLGIPQREAERPATQLDLTLFYNAALDEDLQRLKGNNLKEFLTARTNLLGNTLFDARGIIVLGQADGTLRNYPRSVRGIPVEAPLRRLHVLHAVAFDEDSSGSVVTPTVAEYVLNYADGSRHILSVENDVHLHNWWFHPWYPDQVEAVKKAGMVWQGKNEHVAFNPLQIALYKASWDNPHPEKRVTSIDLVGKYEKGAPLIVGITLE